MEGERCAGVVVVVEGERCAGVVVEVWRVRGVQV